MVRGRRRPRTPPSSREYYGRPAKTHALQRGLTRERGSSFNLDRYQHESSDPGNSEASNADNNGGLNVGGSNTGGGSNDGDSGSNAGSSNADGSNAVDESNERGQHGLVGVGDNASVNSLSRIQPINMDESVRSFNGNVIHAEVAQFDDDEVQFDGVDTPLQEVLIVDMMNDEDRLLNRHNVGNIDAVSDFVEVEYDGGNDYWSSEQDLPNGRALVTWRNDKVAQIPMNIDDFYWLVVVMETPRCRSSEYKLCWHPSNRRFQPTDVLKPYLNKVSMIASHLQVCLGNSHVTSRQKSQKLNSALKTKETDDYLTILLAEKRCDHPKQADGSCLR